jgi:hypothetical protein
MSGAVKGSGISGVPDAVGQLLRRIERTSVGSADQAVELLAATALDESILAPWVDYAHPVRDSYGRKLLARGADFELMVMSWLPGDFSAIHDHGAAEWGAVQYFGPARHVTFEERGNLLSIRRQMVMQTGDVFPVDDSLIHLMGNASDWPFLSLHLYGRSKPAAAVTGNARVFDLLEHRIQRTDGGVFFCLPEADISGREDCPDATPQTRLLHHRLMLERLERIAEEQGASNDLLARCERLRMEIPALQNACDRQTA